MLCVGNTDFQKAIEIKEKPVVNTPKEETLIHWVKPVLVGQFKEKKLEKTKSGSKRHPVIYLGIREDKKPEEIIAEDEIISAPIKKANEAKGTEKTKPRKGKSNAKKFEEVEVWKSIHKDEEIVKKRNN